MDCPPPAQPKKRRKAASLRDAADAKVRQLASKPHPVEPWPVVPLLPERLRDFYIAMPSLARQDIDWEHMPVQLKSNLIFLKALNYREDTLAEAVVVEENFSPLLPPLDRRHKGRRTLVLDLDETLVHCHPSPIPKECTKMEGIKLLIGTTPPLDALLYVRPFATAMLAKMATLFEVVVFTASAAIYADQVIDLLDPSGTCVHHRLYRQQCTEINAAHFKDLRRLGRDMEDLVLIDNSPITLALCPSNGIICQTWLADGDDDKELIDLCNVLEQCLRVKSIPVFLDERYGVAGFFRRLRIEQPPPLQNGEHR